VDPTPDGDLAEAFADIARRLHGESSTKKVHERIGRAAVHTVGGCDHAAISLVYRHRAIDTVGATDDVPHQVDAIQYDVGQGPCLNAIAEHEVFLIDDLAIDERWPLFSRRAAEETGVRSMLSFRLFLEEDVLGALNLYSRKAGVRRAGLRGRHRPGHARGDSHAGCPGARPGRSARAGHGVQP